MVRIVFSSLNSVGKDVFMVRICFFQGKDLFFFKVRICFFQETEIADGVIFFLIFPKK